MCFFDGHKLLLKKVRQCNVLTFGASRKSPYIVQTYLSEWGCGCVCVCIFEFLLTVSN